MRADNNSRWIFSVFLVFAATFLRTHAVPRDQFYSFGTEHGDTRLKIGDDLSSEEVPLQTPIAFYEHSFRSIYVNLNGILSFETELPIYKADLILPFGIKVIAPFLADADTRLSGNVYYRETEDPSVRDMASKYIRSNFPGGASFQPSNLFIVTWDEVGYYNGQYDKTNTFQAVIASDGHDSYAIFLYADNGINWLRSQGKLSPNIQDVPAQAGFDSGDNVRYYKLPGSGNLGAKNLAVRSNVNVPGMWVFRIGRLNADANVETPEGARKTGSGNRGHDGPRSCAAGGADTCHALASCRDYRSGYCCECNPPSYGNGMNCLNIADAQRVNGKVSGTVNGFVIDSQDMHAYVVAADGRAYTAISRVPAEIGVPLQSVFTVGGLIGWLFAKPVSPQAKNGMIITGGDFNRSATIRFNQGEVLEIKQQFLSRDALGYMRVTTQINGNLPPSSNPQAKYTVEDYKEEYSRTSPGVIKSYTTHSYAIDGIPKRYTLDQTITYNECSHRPRDEESDRLRLSTSRNFLVYNERDQIVRYAASNKISTLSGVNPCAEGVHDCGRDANCIPEGDFHRCECKPGYHGDGRRCIDVDECSRGYHGCDVNADCHNTEGSFRCECRPGYTGDGLSCTPREITCGDSGRACHENARCVYDSDYGTERCECQSGYTGDGYTYCTPPDGGGQQGCDVLRNCDRVNARCVYSPDAGQYMCLCNPGFFGDGITCAPEETGTGCDVRNDCDRNARCLYDRQSDRYQCVCNPGFSGDGYRCAESGCERDPTLCDVNAQCAYDSRTGSYGCRCNEGYTGDGSYCRQDESIQSCNVVNTCDLNADCMYDRATNTHACKCRPGYEGDGYRCAPAADCRRDPGICDINARCQTRGDGDYACVCNQGYRGDGSRCQPLGATNSYLMFTQGMSIMQMPFRPSAEDKGKQVLMIPGQTAIGIDVDCYSRYFYWTDIVAGTISRARLDGTDSEVLVRGLSSPEGIAIDWVAKNMYWTDSGLDRIEVSRQDGRNRKTLFSTGLVNPRAIVVDPGHGVVFWSDWNRDSPKIETAHLDGTNRQTLVSENLGLPNGLVLDYRDRQVCWADAGTMHIECIGYDGRGRRAIYSLASYPFGLTYHDNLFYWTDWDRKTLPNIDKYGGSPNEPLEIPKGGNGKLYGITTVREQCPEGSNACVLNNGGCRYLCLPTPNGGRQCACPSDVDEEECNRVNLLK